MHRCLFIILMVCLFSGGASGQEGSDLSPDQHFRFAEKLLSRDECSEALKHINKTIAAKPTDEAYALRAEIHECEGDINAAITDYSVLIYHHPEDAEYLFSRGILQYRAERYEQAVDDLTKSLQFPVRETNKVFYKIEPGKSGISGLSTLSTMQAEIYNYLGLSYYRLANLDSALQHFGRAIALAENPQFYNNRALVHEDKGELSLAIADYEKALQINPQDEVAAYNLMNLYGRTKEFDKQKQIIARIGAHDKLPEVYVYKGVDAYRSGKYQAAIVEYDSALMQDKRNEEVYLYRGQAYEKLREFAKAKDDFEQAIRLNSRYPEAYFSLGNTSYRTNDFDSAVFYYDLAILYKPNYANAYMNRGTVYLRKKELEKACQDLEVAKRLGVKEAEELYGKKCAGQ